jgi:GAG-pre-integrase domain
MHSSLRANTVILEDRVVLTWSKDQIKKTVPMDKSNIGTIYTQAGYSSYSSYCVRVGDYNQPPQQVCATCSFEDDPKAYTAETDDDRMSKGTLMEKAEEMREGPMSIDFSQDMSKNSISTDYQRIDDTYINESRAEDILLLLHYKFGHVSMSRLKKMADMGLLPSKIANCQTPLCQACIYGKMTRRPWRSKPGTSQIPPKRPTKPGEVVSVDHPESPIPGFIGQMKGKLTKQRYKAATIFVDQFSK